MLLRQRVSRATLSVGLVLVLSALPALASISASDGSTPVSSTAVEELLSEPQYRFCNDPGYRLYEDQKTAFCKTAHESADICPGLVAACGRPAWDVVNENRRGSWNFADARWFAAMVQILFWGALALGLGFLLWSAWKMARSQALDFEQEKVVPQARGIELPQTEANPSSSREELMIMAERALAGNQFKESLLHLYKATLQGLADLGWIRLKQSATSGDYTRWMRRHLFSEQPMRTGSLAEIEEAIVHLRALERRRFAQAENPHETTALFERTSELLRRWSAFLICVLSLLSQGCNQTGPSELPDHPAAPGGTLLFEELITRHAVSSKRRFRRLESVDEDTSAVVAMGAELSENEWEVLSSWVREGGALVVVEPTQGFARAFDIQVGTGKCSGELLTNGYEVSEAGKWLAFDDLEADESYFVCGERPVIAGVEWGQGWVTLIATHEILQNAHLAEADHASLVMESIMVDEAEVELLGPWTGRGATSPIQSMIQGDFAIWVLHVLLFFAVAAWGLGRRFGRPSDPQRSHRRAFREHALALGSQYQRVGAHGFALHHFAEWTSEQLRRSGMSGAKVRQQLNPEFSAALSSPSSGMSATASNESFLRTMSLFRKLRGASIRRSVAPRSRSSSEKG